MEASSVETSKRPVINARGWLLIGVVVTRLLSGALNIELMNLFGPHALHLQLFTTRYVSIN